MDDASNAPVRRMPAAAVSSRWGGPPARGAAGSGGASTAESAAGTTAITPAAPGIVGWDIGGGNTKVALLARLAASAGATPHDAHAITMTAELSQIFRTKREGIGVVLDAVTAAFPAARAAVFTVDGRFLDLDAARAEPLAVAASNWAATAGVVARD